MNTSHRYPTLTLALLLSLLVAACGSVEEEPATPPTIVLTAPTQNATVSGTVTISAAANGSVSRVEFYFDGAPLGTRTEAPWTFEWDTETVADGPHTLQVKAYNESGDVAEHGTPITVANAFRVTFRNPTPTTIRLFVAGQAERSIASGGSTVFTYPRSPGSVSYKADTRGSTGILVYWEGTVPASNGASESVSLAVSGRTFFLRLRNTSGRDMKKLTVAYKQSGERKVEPFSLGSSWKNIGYFKGHSSTTIRVDAKYRFPELATPYWQWSQSVSTSPNTVVSQTLTSGSGAQGDDGVNMLVVADDPQAAAFAADEPDGLVHYSREGDAVDF